MKDGEEAEALITYEGRLLNGTVFDASPEPITISFNDNLIVGISEAIKKMPVGAEWDIYIPSAMAFRERRPGIEPGAAVIFRVKLLELIPHRSTTGSPIELTPEMLKHLEEAGL